MIDSHTHLHLCEPPDADLVQAAREAGVTRIVTVGTTPETNRQALAAADQFPAGLRGDRTPSERGAGFDDDALADLETLAGHERCVAIGETGLDYYRDYAPPAAQQRAFEAQIELARRPGKPLVIHTRAADEDTLGTLREFAGGVKVVLHCFSMAGADPGVPGAARLVGLVCRQRHVSQGGSAARSDAPGTA